MAASDELVEIGIFAGFILLLLYVGYLVQKTFAGFKLPSLKSTGGTSSQDVQQGAQSGVDAVAPYAAAIGGGVGSALGTSVGTAAAQTVVTGTKSTLDGADQTGKTIGDWFWGEIQPFLPESWQAPAHSGPDMSELNLQNWHPFAGVTTDVETTTLDNYNSVPYIDEQPLETLDVPGQSLA